jgi:hypothetical protein
MGWTDDGDNHYSNSHDRYDGRFAAEVGEGCCE